MKKSRVRSSVVGRGLDTLPYLLIAVCIDMNVRDNECGKVGSQEFAWIFLFASHKLSFPEILL